MGIRIPNQLLHDISIMIWHLPGRGRRGGHKQRVMFLNSVTHHCLLHICYRAKWVFVAHTLLDHHVIDPSFVGAGRLSSVVKYVRILRWTKCDMMVHATLTVLIVFREWIYHVICIKTTHLVHHSSPWVLAIFHTENSLLELHSVLILYCPMPHRSQFTHLKPHLWECFNHEQS